MQKVKKFVLNQAKRKLKFVLDPVKLKVRSRYTRNVMHYAKLYKNTEVDEHFVMYQVRDGKSMTDSPYAIFNYLIHDKSFEKYQHIWIVSTQAQQKTYAKKYRKYNNIKFIIKESEEYLYYLTKCKYLINNATFPAYFTKKPEQIYVNTWHGTPLKLMGLDIKDNLIESQNTIKNFLSSDYLISPNRHTTEIFKNAFKLQGLNEEAILEVGYPRIDATFNTDEKEVKRKLKKQGINVSSSPILLFSPTWRGTAINNLLENINYDQYDVTIFTQLSKNKDAIENIKNINENVRVILRKEPLLATTTEYYRNKLVQNRSLRTKFEEKIYPDNLYKREFRKIFGNSKFDVAIDFSGYAMFWSELVIASEAKTKLVYLHSDMKMDMERTVNGLRPHYVNLKGIMSMYPLFDKLVSVSEVTKDENLKKIGNNKTSEKYKAAVNTINLEKINNQVNDDNDIFMKNGERVIVRQIDKHISSVPFHEKDYKVMAMGRLSPEKGFDNLIKSFEEIVKNNPTTKLYILGDGPLRNQLNNLIISLNLTENIFLMGQKRNPFYIMKECDLFVLPSYYEGQSMVLLEALTIGINVLASDIPANQYVLDYGKYGMLSDNDAETLTTSIQQFIDNDTNEYAEFDAELYNKDAINQFYNLFRN